MNHIWQNQDKEIAALREQAVQHQAARELWARDLREGQDCVLRLELRVQELERENEKLRFAVQQAEKERDDALINHIMGR